MKKVYIQNITIKENNESATICIHIQDTEQNVMCVSLDMAAFRNFCFDLQDVGNQKRTERRPDV